MVMLKIIPLMISAVTVFGCLEEIALAQVPRELTNNSPPIINQQSENKHNYLSKILLIAGLASGAGLIGWRLSQYRQFQVGGSMPRKAHHQLLIDRVSPRLRRQLLRLINDPKTANRLLLGIQKHHPHRPPDWIAEKVIYDFQRGR
ncbi:MAG: hypothetical protein AAGF83_27650 [Cyanobacteria bacterium P01_G01_bin.67]